MKNKALKREIEWKKLFVYMKTKIRKKKQLYGHNGTPKDLTKLFLMKIARSQKHISDANSL